jgi:hypothetical protein
MSLNQIRSAISKHTSPTQPGKGASLAAKPQYISSKSAQVMTTLSENFGKGPTTVYVAAYKPSAPDSNRHYGTCAIYIHNQSGPDILQTISRAFEVRFVLDQPEIQHHSSQSRAEIPSGQGWDDTQGKLDRRSEYLEKAEA